MLEYTIISIVYIFSVLIAYKIGYFKKTVSKDINQINGIQLPVFDDPRWTVTSYTLPTLLYFDKDKLRLGGIEIDINSNHIYVTGLRIPGSNKTQQYINAVRNAVQQRNALKAITQD